MIPLTITPDIERAPWDDINPANIVECSITRIGLLPNGTEGGHAVVMVEFKLPGDPKSYIGQTTLRLANTAARALSNSPVYLEEDFS